MYPKSHVQCPHQKQKRKNRETQKKIHVKMEAEMEVIHLQAKGWQGLAEPPEARRGAWSIFLRTRRRRHPAGTLLGLLAIRTVRKYISVILSNQVWGNLLWQPKETNTHNFSLCLGIKTRYMQFFGLCFSVLWDFKECYWYQIRLLTFFDLILFLLKIFIVKWRNKRRCWEGRFLFLKNSEKINIMIPQNTIFLIV